MKNRIISGIRTNFFPINKGDTILDFGFGDGSKSIAFSQLDMCVTAADINKENLDKLQKYIHDHKLKNIKLIYLSPNKPLPFSMNTFDKVIANEVLEHISNTSKTLKELHRVLKTNGTLCISVPTAFTENVYNKLNIKYKKSAGHVHAFKKNEILKLVKNSGFSIKYVSQENFQFAIYWLIQSLFKINPTGNGTQREKPVLDLLYWKIWGMLHVLRIGNFLIYIGNKVFPKSLYIYASK